jgi:hypothetical protein
MSNLPSRPAFRLSLIVAMLALTASLQGNAMAETSMSDQDDGGGYSEGDQGDGQSTDASADDECGATVEASRC